MEDRSIDRERALSAVAQTGLSSLLEQLRQQYDFVVVDSSPVLPVPDALMIGQQVDAVITNIDLENRRLSLSIKDLEPNAWDRFFETHKLGDVITGKVVRFANFGAFVEIEEGIEGLCHVSELSDERVEKPEDAVKIGQTLPFKVLKLDPAQKKIGLSARAVGKENDPEDVRSYQETGTGMVTLGDLAKLIGPDKKSEE